MGGTKQRRLKMVRNFGKHIYNGIETIGVIILGLGAFVIVTGMMAIIYSLVYIASPVGLLFILYGIIIGSVELVVFGVISLVLGLGGFFTYFTGMGELTPLGSIFTSGLRDLIQFKNNLKNSLTNK